MLPIIGTLALLHGYDVSSIPQLNERQGQNALLLALGLRADLTSYILSVPISIDSPLHFFHPSICSQIGCGGLPGWHRKTHLPLLLCNCFQSKALPSNKAWSFLTCDNHWLHCSEITALKCLCMCLISTLFLPSICTTALWAAWQCGVGLPRPTYIQWHPPSVLTALLQALPSIRQGD